MNWFHFTKRNFSTYKYVIVYLWLNFLKIKKELENGRNFNDYEFNEELWKQ